MGKKIKKHREKQDSFIYYLIFSLLLVSFVLVFIGSILTNPDTPVWERLFIVIQIFRMENEYPASNAHFLLRMGSWICPVIWLLFCATVLVSFKSWITYAGVLFAVKKKHLIAIQGDHPLCPALLEDLEGKAIYEPDVEASLKANEQILYFSDDDKMLSFIGQYRDQITNKKISILSDTLNPTSMENKDIDLYYIPERTAQEYWCMHPLENDASVAIIGFGIYGQELLLNALRTQIYSLDSNIEYHIFPLKDDKCDDFRKSHWNYDLIASVKKEKYKDIVIFESFDCWMDAKDRFKLFDRVIICPDKDEMSTAIRHNIRLMDLSVKAHIHSKLSNPGNSILYSHNSPMIESDCWFGALTSIYASFSKEESEIIQRARCVNGLYRMIFEYELMDLPASGFKAVDKYFKEVWKNLNTKEKRSNIFSVLHEGAKRKILKDKNINTVNDGKLSLYHIVAADCLRLIMKYKEDDDFAKGFAMHVKPADPYSMDDVIEAGLSLKLILKLFYMESADDVIKAESFLFSYIKGMDYSELCNCADCLLEIEHERWRRDYYLDNWVYGPKTNKAMRVHKDLVPYAELGGDRQKDWLGYWAIMLMDRGI